MPLPQTGSRPILLALACGAALACAGQAGAAGCSSPYYPIREGLTRAYQGTVGGQKVAYTERVSGVSAQGFKVTTTVQGAPPTTATFKCGPGGVVANPSLSNPALKITSVQQRGVTQPLDLKVGTAWKSGVTVVGTAQGQTVHNDTDISLRVVGSEQVKTPLGTYTALKVTSTTTIKLTVAGQVVTQPTVNSTSWLVKDIGLVKSTLPNGSVNLVSFK